MVGTLEALALTQIVPERSPEILRRLDQYTRNRVVCGVHYPSDVAASRIVATALFGLIAASPVYQKELASARSEVRSHLALYGSSARPGLMQNKLPINAVSLSPAAVVLEEEGNARSKSSVR